MKELAKKIPAILIVSAMLSSCSAGVIIDKAAIIILGIYIGAAIIAASGENFLGIIAGIAIIIFTVFFLPSMLSDDALKIVGGICTIIIFILAFKYFFLK